MIESEMTEQDWPDYSDTYLAGVSKRFLQLISNLQIVWDLDSVLMAAVLGMTPTRWQEASLAEEPLLTNPEMHRATLALAVQINLSFVFKGDEEKVTAWIHRPHAEAPFHGRVPLEQMMGSPEDLQTVKTFLDRKVGGSNGTPYGDAG